MRRREHFINVNRQAELEAIIRHQKNVPDRNSPPVKVVPIELVNKANISILKFLLDEKDLKTLGLL